MWKCHHQSSNYVASNNFKYVVFPVQSVLISIDFDVNMLASANRLFTLSFFSLYLIHIARFRPVRHEYSDTLGYIFSSDVHVASPCRHVYDRLVDSVRQKPIFFVKLGVPCDNHRLFCHRVSQSLSKHDVVSHHALFHDLHETSNHEIVIYEMRALFV